MLPPELPEPMLLPVLLPLPVEPLAPGVVPDEPDPDELPLMPGDCEDEPEELLPDPPDCAKAPCANTAETTRAAAANAIPFFILTSS
jgi:hypothetical protein